MNTSEDIYAGTNAAWIAAGVKGWHHTKLGEAEARRMALALWKVAEMPRKRVTVRKVWKSQGVKRLVHDVSHFIWIAKRPAGTRAHHCVEHASWERSLTLEAIKRGWHLPKKPRAVRPAKPAPDPLVVKRTKLEARLKAWRTRSKRAATAIKKLERAVRRLGSGERRTRLGGDETLRVYQLPPS
jgi:hypothetical protein